MQFFSTRPEGKQAACPAHGPVEGRRHDHDFAPLTDRQPDRPGVPVGSLYAAPRFCRRCTVGGYDRRSTGGESSARARSSAIRCCVSALATMASLPSKGVWPDATGASASCMASVPSKAVSSMLQSLLGRSVFHGSPAGRRGSDSTRDASPTIQPLLRRSVRHGSSCSPSVTTQASCRVLMPDSYSDCKKLAAPSRQHLRGAHVTQTGHWRPTANRSQAPRGEFKVSLAQEFSNTSPVRCPRWSDCKP